MQTKQLDYDTLETKIYDYLLKKEKYLNEIFRLTKITKFNNSEEDAQIFINMIEKRENIIEEIKIIDFELSSSKYKNIFEQSNNIISLNEKIKQIIRQIVDLDKVISIKADAAFLEIKKRIKDYNYGKSLNDAYYGIAQSNNYYDVQYES